VQSENEPTDVEGLDPILNSGWAEYPLDSVFVRKEERTVGEAIKRIKAGRYKLDPDFQRSFVWNVEQQSKLIESCVMRIPLPVLYVAEAPDGKIIVVDGLQRLTTLLRFMENQFRLKGLANSYTPNHPLEGRSFRELPLNLRERIEDTQLTFYILDAKAPERARLDIFDRVNSGVALTRQQMRNSLYNGPATRWLKEAAEKAEFLSATGRSLDPKTMRDREVINRFCAFKLQRPSSYRGDMDGFIGRALEKLNAMSEKERTTLLAEFTTSMKWNHKIFGSHAFRKSVRDESENARRSIINIALFDVLSVYFSDVTSLGGAERKIKSRVIDLLEDDDFSLAITYSTNSTSAVKTRFEMLDEALADLFS
jgi:hypothetical protein